MTICARSKDKLEKAVEQVKVRRGDHTCHSLSINVVLHRFALQKSARTSSQKVGFVSADMSDFEEAKTALATASDSGLVDQVGRVPDAVFACAGGAQPGFFLEQKQSNFEKGFKIIYMTALATSHVRHLAR